MASYVGCRRERERGPEALKKEGQAMKKVRIMVLECVSKSILEGEPCVRLPELFAAACNDTYPLFL